MGKATDADLKFSTYGAGPCMAGGHKVAVLCWPTYNIEDVKWPSYGAGPRVVVNILTKFQRDLSIRG